MIDPDNRDEMECPFCGKRLIRSYMGFNAHLRPHIKAGLLKVQDRRNLFRQIFKGLPPTNEPSRSDIRRAREGFTQSAMKT